MKPGVVVHVSNPSTQEAGAGGYQVQGQSGLHTEILSQNKMRGRLNLKIKINKKTALAGH
jgi:hypothetical protein